MPFWIAFVSVGEFINYFSLYENTHLKTELIFTFTDFLTTFNCFSRFRDFLLTLLAMPTSLMTSSIFCETSAITLDGPKLEQNYQKCTSSSLSDSSDFSSDPRKNCSAVTMILVTFEVQAVQMTFTVLESFQIFFLYKSIITS